MRWLILHFTAPLAAFGGKMVDGWGPTGDFPALSAVTGLLGNALGYERHLPGPLDALQERIIFGARHDAKDRPIVLRDFQTAKLEKNDRGWTFRGIEGREGGADTYDNPAIRERDYLADIRMTVTLRLRDDLKPDLDDLAAAIMRPARPLFIGRKSCLPSGPIFGGFIEAADTIAALRSAPRPTFRPGIEEDAPSEVIAQWPLEDAHLNDGMPQRVSDIRSFRGEVHKGARKVMTGTILTGAI
jgi:CRISPR system Cascade subunit CasD